MARTWRSLFRLAGVACVATSLASCSDKTAGAALDAGEASLSRALIAVPEGGAGALGAAAADGGIEDTALPQASSEELSARMRHLVEALSQDNPDLANDVLFPRDAYAATKDLPDPAKAWEKRVQGAFRRSVEHTHKNTKGIEGAKFVSFELGHAMAQLTPHKKDFKRPLWRVKHSKLAFSVEGKTHHVDIAEMTAWRGAWYVTRLR